MSPEPTEPADVTTVPATGAAHDTGQDLTAEDLVEEVSIDGMCGVY